MCQASAEATSGTRREPPHQWLYLAPNVPSFRQLCSDEIKAAEVADGSISVLRVRGAVHSLASLSQAQRTAVWRTLASFGSRSWHRLHSAMSVADSPDSASRAASSNHFCVDDSPASAGCCLWLYCHRRQDRRCGLDESKAYRPGFGLNVVFADLRRSFLVRRSPPAEEGGWLACWAKGWRRSSSRRSSWCT
jgi:hypothetical protein